MNTNTAQQLFSSSLNYISLDIESIQDAKNRFLDFQELKTIKSTCSFDDPVWYTTDEYSNVGLHFTFNRFSYKKYAPIFNMDLDSFVVYVKSFLISIMGKISLMSIQGILLDIRHIIEMDIQDVYDMTGQFNIYHPTDCYDFFSMLPDFCNIEEIDNLLNAFDLYAEYNLSQDACSKRTLADFDTYFTFNDLIKDYWNSSLSNEDRLFYYPLYIWWILTATIPLRPREFLLTQRNCLIKSKDGEYYLKLRRNKLKGGNRNISYKLSEDYTIDTYQIPTSLGKEIENYISLTEQYGHTDLDTLFITDTHYKKWGQSKHSDSRFLTYINMNTILKYFYREIICDKYNLKVVYECSDRHLNDDEIRYIHLGDTRHIALINIMQEGGTPTTAMFLAGHTNDVMASHYYSNLTSLIECKTYRQYRKLLSGDVKYQISLSTPLPITDSGTTLSDGGRCFSTAYLNGDISDCRNVIGENGEIGYCPSCMYYRPNGTSFFSQDDIYKSTIYKDCEALTDAIDLLRKGKGSVEDIGEAFLKIQSSSLSYQSYLMEKQHANNNI